MFAKPMPAKRTIALSVLPLMLSIVAVPQGPVRVEGQTVTTCDALNGTVRQNNNYSPAAPAELKRYLTHSMHARCPAKTKCEPSVTVQVYVWGPKVWCATAEKGSLAAKQAAVGAAMKWRFEKGRGAWKSNLVGNITVPIDRAG